ncbi:hypothetical protein CALCODRAFT_91983 [Calocera cornea HHB12733]|uniref:Uncharacterized protein n=1 Tax=Calocera cornea HHB12733 TaxID=1353952 RepID=A0A165DAD4_9BASI|nr:hypothetical protein CALCODRAFT_91983 [Calocera cornea HHB12733]
MKFLHIASTGSFLRLLGSVSAQYLWIDAYTGQGCLDANYVQTVGGEGTGDHVGTFNQPVSSVKISSTSYQCDLIVWDDANESVNMGEWFTDFPGAGECGSVYGGETYLSYDIYCN